jgi:hypothetical protein
MRLLLLMLGISDCVVGIGTRAEAQNYPWCAIYSGRAGGANCGFTTFEQCMEIAGSAACANRTHNISLRPDRIHRRGC